MLVRQGRGPHLDWGSKARRTATRLGLVCLASRAQAFENAITVVYALGGSTNCVLHLLAIAHEAQVPLQIHDFDRIGKPVPLLANLSPQGPAAADARPADQKPPFCPHRGDFPRRERARALRR